MSKKLILVTNDDGITAKGIKSLIEVAKKFGKVVVVAPDSPQSAMGHAITISKPLRAKQVNIFQDVEAWECSGTPVDCVKLAIDKMLPRLPDLCLSGINHGSNASINIIYSGTMSAALEGAVGNIPSIGFSLLDYAADADFTASKHFAQKVIEKALNSGFPKSKLFNVNIPKGEIKDIKGIKLCRQANGHWKEEFNERIDPFKRKYYWMTGRFINNDSGKDTDIVALENNYVSVVPVQYDLTAHDFIKEQENKWIF